MKNSSENQLSKNTGYRYTVAYLFVASLLSGCVSSVTGLAPTVDGPSSVEAGSTVSYTFDALSPKGYALSYGVNWGDGSSLPTALNIPSGDKHSGIHAWSQSGNYTITVIVSDGHGGSSTGSYAVQVVNPPAE